MLQCVGVFLITLFSNYLSFILSIYEIADINSLDLCRKCEMRNAVDLINRGHKYKRLLKRIHVCLKQHKHNFPYHFSELP